METPFEYNKQSLKKVELFKSVINAAQDMIQEKLSANRTRVIILNKLDEVSDLINISIKEDQIAKASKAYADNGSKP